jgi:hypothetical protein
MTNDTYVLPTKPTIYADDGQLAAGLSHLWAGDYDEAENQAILREFTVADAMAASGDYFITLATRLDKLAQGLPLDSSEQIELEHQVKILFYMQDHYDLIAKYKRQ